MNQSQKPVTLIILDGWGYREGKEHNAILEAQTPFFDHLWQNYPHTLLNASEQHVGLPGGTIGNSEVGHMTMGAGRVIDTDLVRISKAMESGEFNTNPAFAALFEHVKNNHSTLHVMGLVSDGGVHSHREHLHGFLTAAKEAGIEKVAIHAFTDGRDVAPQSGGKYLQDLEKVIANLGIGHIATASGRYFAMDRDKNWHRTKLVEDAIFEGIGKMSLANKPSDVIKELYKTGELDELLEPLIFLDDKGKAMPVQKNDGIFFFNFRSDRPRQLTQKIVERAKKHNLYFVTLTEYDPALESVVAFPPNKIETTLAAEISQAGLTQSHIAETEKYAHVTYFFNGGKQEPHKNEHHFLIESRRDIKTHDEAPEMRAREIADKSIERLNAGDDFLVINFANADMVGHTANKPAIITAVETVDRELKRVVDVVLAKGGIALITADHGNAELNFDASTGHKHTAHTLNQVPFIIAEKSGKWVVSSEKSKTISVPPPLPTEGPTKSALGGRSWMGEDVASATGEGAVFPSLDGRGEGRVTLNSSRSLADIAPTTLALMQIKKPSAMTGESLIVSD